MSGADEEHIDLETGMTLLHRACGDGQLEIAELLISRGARVGARDSNGATPLHYACVSNQPEVVELLLSHDADVFAEDKSGATVYHIAQMQGYSKVLSTLSTRHLLRHWNRLNTPPVCQVSPAPVPNLVSKTGAAGSSNQDGDEGDWITASMKIAFGKYDVDGTGKIPVESLGDLAVDLNEPLEPEEIEAVAHSLDPTKTGEVLFDDFATFWLGVD